MVQRKRSQTSLQLQCRERFLVDDLRLCAAVNAKEGKLLMPSKRDKFPAKRGYPVRLMERIGEKSNA